MARYGGQTSSTTGSGFTGSGSGEQLLQAKAGKEVIAKDDLVVNAGMPARLYPVKRIDYAAIAVGGGNAVALTTVASGGAGATNFVRNRAIVDPASGDIFYADATTYSSASLSTGAALWKYSAQGTYLKSVVFDSGGGNVPFLLQTMFLSNGNILVFWWVYGVANGMHFAIVDKQLNVVVPKTALISNSAVYPGSNPIANAHCIVLSGGGFAVAWGCPSGAAITIRSNAGAVVYAEALISGTTTNNSGNVSGMNFRLAQLSDGNIFVGINDTSTSIGARLCYAIYSPTGAVVKAFTTVADSAGNFSQTNDYPEVSVLPGFVCLCNGGGKAVVISNSGAIQGAALPPSGNLVRLASDGAHFWVFASGTSGGSLIVTRLPVTGAANKVQTPLENSGPLAGDVLIDGDGFVTFDATSCFVLAKEADGTVSIVEKCAFALSGMTQTIKLTDFCAMAMTKGQFQITKYRAASIFGVAQVDNPANNAGVLVPVATGVGGSSINPIQGSSGKAYDHRSASVAGTSGAMYHDAVTFKGIA